MTGWDWVIDCKGELGFMGAGVNWGKGNNLARVIFLFLFDYFDRGKREMGFGLKMGTGLRFCGVG